MNQVVTLLHVFLAYIQEEKYYPDYMRVHLFARDFVDIAVDYDGCRLVAAAVQELQEHSEISKHMLAEMNDVRVDVYR